jgi:hypothetical protein
MTAQPSGSVPASFIVNLHYLSCVLSLLLYHMSKLQKILIAAAPIIAQLPLLSPVLQVATQAGILQYLHDAGDSERLMQLLQASDKPDGPPCPDLGGQCITEEWLMSLKDRDCLWHFR